MIRTRKVWLGLGVAATIAASGTPATAETATAPTPPAKGSVDDYPITPFKNALTKMLGGEGGETGNGFNSFGPTTIGVPPLNDAQIKASLPGNTLRKDRSMAIYFDPSGAVEGWKKDWQVAPRDKCPSPIGDNHYLDEHSGVCRVSANYAYSGTWSVRDGKLCMPAFSGKKEEGEGCYYLAFVLESVALSDGAKLLGGAKQLVSGKQLMLSRPKS